ncbi:MAG: metal-binding protein [Acidimicrobiia bacterium]|jgi:uncharacterized protein|nr:MAG: metal-binding protein [Acidimicrobiia bacterium]
MAFRFLVADLLADPGRARTETGSVPVSFEFPQARIEDVVEVTCTLRSLTDGVVARGTITVAATLLCNRCLTDWVETRRVPFEQVYRWSPSDVDELAVEPGGYIDLEGVVRDEVALSVPLAPLCRADCRGLCPECGTDLNVAPCGGHGDEKESPFAPLRQLFDQS